MYNHEISNFTMSRQVVSGGETLTLNFTLKNLVDNDGEQTILSQSFYLSVRTGSTALMADNPRISNYISLEGVNLKYGKSRDYSLSFSIKPEYEQAIKDYFENNPDQRALEIWLQLSSTFDDSDNVHLSVADRMQTGGFFIPLRLSPTIETFVLERATNGVPSDEGENLLTTLKISCTDGRTEMLNLRLHYAQGTSASETDPFIDLSAHYAALKAGVTDDGTIITQSFANGVNWSFLLVFGDDYEKTIASASIARAFANLHLSGHKTGGACFGGFSKSVNGKPILESYFRFYPYGGIDGVNIYREEEVKTGGLWIDNKPVYRRVVKIPEIAKGSTSTGAVATIAEGIENIVHFTGVLYREDRVYGLGFETLGSTKYQADFWIGIGDNKISIRTNSSTPITGGHVIVEYTKAADEPIEDYAGYAILVDSEGYMLIDKDGYQLLGEVN